VTDRNEKARERKALVPLCNVASEHAPRVQVGPDLFISLFYSGGLSIVTD